MAISDQGDHTTPMPWGEQPSNIGPMEGRALRQAMAEFASRMLSRIDSIDTTHGRMAAELGAIGTRLGRIEARLDKIRPDSDRPVSHHDLAELKEELSSPGVRFQSHPVKAAAERIAGKIFLWIALAAAGGVVVHFVEALFRR